MVGIPIRGQGPSVVCILMKSFASSRHARTCTMNPCGAQFAFFVFQLEKDRLPC